ncbi:hypothetical protein WYO_4893 [Methylobacterium sp. GXF4]|nr:hypothetical protein WYO_4893 [Methylobacterium sp. GXF4]
MDLRVPGGRYIGRRISVVILLGSVLTSARLAQAAEPVLAVLPIKLLDTSAEPTDQRAAHTERLASLGSDLASALGTPDLYRTLRVKPDDLRAACPSETPDCLLGFVRAAGASLAFVGVVHKSSTLIMQMWARIVDARSGRVLFTRELNFRGDNDEAWRRATEFLVAQIRSDPPSQAR